MNTAQWIDRDLLKQAAAAAATAPRRRKNHNFHAADTDLCHRLLNAMQPDSYIRPHSHCGAGRDETILALRGRFGLVLFAPDGKVLSTKILEPNGAMVGVNVPVGAIHTIVCLEPDSVFFESKLGPFVPLSEQEKAAWAPAEGGPGAPAFLETLRRMFT